MAEGGFDFEMDNFDENEIENYNRSQLNDYYIDISEERIRLYDLYANSSKTPEEIKVKYREYDAILDMIDEQINKNKEAETSFIDNDNGKTVKITGPGGEEIYAPHANIVKRFRSQVTSDKKANIKKILGMDYEFRVGDGNNSKDLINNTRIIFGKNDKLIGLEYKGKRIYITNDQGKTYSRTTDKRYQDALKEFDNLRQKAVDEHNETEESRDNMDLINIDPDNNFIEGLTNEENRELGVLNPSDTIDKSTRPLYLEKQAIHLQETINETNKMFDDNDLNYEEKIELGERITGLENARDITLKQMEKEEIRSQQEEDISRFQRFKEWAKENLLGLSAVAIALAGIITTVVVSARGVIYKGAAGVNKFAKAVYNTLNRIAKALGPIIGPILSAIGSILAAVLKYGAKGLEWLSKNLWALVIGITLILYEKYKK